MTDLAFFLLAGTCAAAGLALCALVSWRVDGAAEALRGFALDLIYEAERYYGAGTGRFKQAYVINRLLNGAFFAGLPSVVRAFLTAKRVGGIVDAVVAGVFNPQKAENKAVKGALGL